MKAIGPATLFVITDIATGAGVRLTDMESVSLDPGARMLGTSNAFTGDAWQEDGLYSLAPAPSVQAELYATDIDAIAALLLGAEKFSKDTDTTPDGVTDIHALGFGKPGLKKIDPANVPALFVLPEFDAAAGIASEYGIWLPAVAVESLASIVYNRPTAGGNANSYSVTFKGAQRKVLGGQTLPESACFGWIGSPSALTGVVTTGWTLPA